MIHLAWCLAAAEDVQAFCQKHYRPFCFIGGVAVQRWGEPRLTQDVDLTLLTGFGHEEEYIDPLLEAYSARRADAREFALIHRVLLVSTASGVAGDLALGAFPFEERAIQPSSSWRLTDKQTLPTCSA